MISINNHIIHNLQCILLTICAQLLFGCYERMTSRIVYDILTEWNWHLIFLTDITQVQSSRANTTNCQSNVQIFIKANGSLGQALMQSGIFKKTYTHTLINNLWTLRFMHSCLKSGRNRADHRVTVLHSRHTLKPWGETLCKKASWNRRHQDCVWWKIYFYCGYWSWRFITVFQTLIKGVIDKFVA